MLPTKFRVIWPFGSGEEASEVWSELAFEFRRISEKIIFKMAAMAAILDIRSAGF